MLIDLIKKEKIIFTFFYIFFLQITCSRLSLIDWGMSTDSFFYFSVLCLRREPVTIFMGESTLRPLILGFSKYC